MRDPIFRTLAYLRVRARNLNKKHQKRKTIALKVHNLI